MLKHKNIWVMSILSSALALSACQPQKAEPQPEEKPKAEVPDQSMKLIGDSEALKLSMPDCDGNSCPEISISRLSSNQNFIDRYIDDEILKQLGQILSVEPAQEKAQAAASETAAASEVKSALAQVETPKIKLEKQTAPYMQAFTKLDQELKALNSAQKISLMIKPKILNAELPLATVVLNSSSYLGGAHGSSSQQYYNFDIQAKKLVRLDQIIEPKQRGALEKKAHEAFTVWVEDSKLADSVAEYEQAWKFKLSENYFLGKDGLILQYGEYEIGPYAVGLPRLTIPYDALKGILKPQYFPAAAIKPASEAKAAS
ncbi:RsiV family protein [Acinetobacter sp.]|jgi:hypothetical protein|uniref:RsiV family protein n=1 Tax=Acinetobacter sp. TaxID=472 RepID=UPI0035AEE3D6